MKLSVQRRRNVSQSMSLYRPLIKSQLSRCTWMLGLVLVMWTTVGCQGTGCLFTPPASNFVTADYAAPAIIITGLRPCPVGRAYRRPLIIEAYDDRGAFVTGVPFSGLTDGVNPVGVPLYPGADFHGRLRIRIGECPPLLGDPLAALKCEPVQWLREFSVRVPEQAAHWRTVHDVSLRRSRCLPPRD